MTARLYFANLCADVVRCLKAIELHDEKKYSDSLRRAYKTLHYLRIAKRPEAYEEGLLMVRGLEYARESESAHPFYDQVNRLAASFATV